MNNRFSKEDIFKFDPTYASVENIRAWLFAIIDEELEKDPAEIDYDLIQECSELEKELAGEADEMSEADCAVGIQRIKSIAGTKISKSKRTKTLKTKKKSKRTIRVITVLVALFATLFLIVTALAVSQGSVGDFIFRNIQKIFNIDTGDELHENNITLIKYGEASSYSSVEDAVKDISASILLPQYLPENAKIEEIIVAKGANNQDVISFISNVPTLSIRITTNDTLSPEETKNLVLYKTQIADFYVYERNGYIGAIGFCGGNKLDIKYSDYNELIKTLDGLMEVVK